MQMVLKDYHQEILLQAGDVAQVEHLPNKYKVLSSNASTAKWMTQIDR
jgi:hypothetical protein